MRNIVLPCDSEAVGRRAERLSLFFLDLPTEFSLLSRLWRNPHWRRRARGEADGGCMKVDRGLGEAEAATAAENATTAAAAVVGGVRG